VRGVSTYRDEVQAILSGSAAEYRGLLETVSPALRASLPVDATGIAQAIEHLAGAVELGDEVRAEQALGHRANPAVLHGRVFGREPLSPDTVLAAFADGARVREGVLVGLASAIGGDELASQTRGVLDAAPPPSAGGEASTDALRAAYAAQERTVLALAEHLDASG
jgi:hypothetical protein